MFAHLKNNKKLLYSIMAFTVGLALILAFNLIQNLQLIIAAIKEFMGHHPCYHCICDCLHLMETNRIRRKKSPKND